MTMQPQILGGRYVLKDKIGAGGMATVFRAQDQTLDRVVAVKIMLPQYASDPNFAARFKQEAQAAAGLQSPYIVGVYDWGKEQNTYYIVMEYLRGTDLKTGIKSHGALDPKKVAQIGSQICSALSVAHKHEIIHRDIKPQNIMVQPDGNIKVMDFGIARAKNSHLTQDNNVLGTAHYVSPEQTRGQELGPTTDLYSLGVVMYECATGNVPFDGDDAISVALKQVQEMPVPPSQVNPNVDPDLERIILKCMDKDPANRFQTADELKTVLNSYLAGHTLAFAPAGATTVMSGSDPTRVMASATPSATTAMPRAAAPLPSNTAINPNIQSSDPYTTASGKPKKKKSKGKTVGIVVGALLAIAAACYVGYTMMGSNDLHEVGNYVDMTLQEATEQIYADGFKVDRVTEEYNDEVAEGVVVDQTPDAGRKVKEGTHIDLIVSKGEKPADTITIPDVKNMTQNEAKKALEDLKLKVVIVRDFDESVEADKAIKTEPSAGSEVEEGSTVTLHISSGAEDVKVPGVLGLTEGEASNQLINSGFNPVTVEGDYSTNYPKGTVMKQDTGSMTPGSDVRIWISKGPKDEGNNSSGGSDNPSSKPDSGFDPSSMQGWNESDAAAEAINHGYHWTREEKSSGEYPKGTVIAAEIRNGDTVHLIISAGK